MNLLTSLCRRHAAAPLCSGAARGLLFFLRPHVAPARRRHSTSRSTRSHSRWRHNPWNFASAAVLLTAGGAGLLIAAGHGSYYTLETIPYTNRTHFVFRTPQQERDHAESRFSYLKNKYASITLGENHHQTVRVSRVASRLIRAVQRDLVDAAKSRHGDDSSGTGSAAEMEDFRRKQPWRKERRGSWLLPQRPAQTRHLDGLDWEAIVLRDKHVDMWSLPAGKIIVPTALLDFYNTDDAELAFVIAHEIGHIVARHWAEKIMYEWLPRPLKVPFTRRSEREADHIGMMLLGAAGFDPRVAPRALEKLGVYSNRGFLNTHPSCKKRSQLLSQSKIMGEALELYREFNPGQDSSEGSL